MNRPWLLTLSGAFSFVLLSSESGAESPLLHFPLESADDGEAKLYTNDGGSAAAVPGKIGKALRFDGQAVLALPFNLDHAEYPQVTITAWVKHEADAGGVRAIFSNGSGAGARLQVGGSVSAKAGRRGITYGHGGVPSGEWVFVAFVADTANDWARLHQNDQEPYLKDGIDPTDRPPNKFNDPDNRDAEKEAFVFVGGNNFYNWGSTSRTLAIDDVRVYASALSEEQIAAIREGGATSDETPEMIGETEKNDTGAVGFSTGPGIAQAPQRIDTATIGTPRGAPDLTGGNQFDGSGRSVGEVPDSIQNPELDAPEGAPELKPTIDRSVGQIPDDIENPDIASLPAGAPDPQYDSPEAAEEAARQREEAARKRAEDEETQDQQQALEGGIAQPVGSPVYSIVAGFTGEIQKTLDLETLFLHEIEWDQVNAKPCRISVKTNDMTKPGGLKNLDIGCPQNLDGALAKTARYVRVDPQVITEIRVCNSNSTRLKGIQIGGATIQDDGTLRYGGASDAESYTNCGEFSGPMLCPNHWAATGLVVHSADSSGDKEFITGLQLICRAIGLK